MLHCFPPHDRTGYLSYIFFLIGITFRDKIPFHHVVADHPVYDHGTMIVEGDDIPFLQRNRICRPDIGNAAHRDLRFHAPADHVIDLIPHETRHRDREE